MLVAPVFSKSCLVKAGRRKAAAQKRMEMAATSEEGLESLLLNLDQIYQGYKDAVSEAQSLKLNYGSEIRRREAVEATCNDLRRDNERLRRLYTECLTKLTNQIKRSAHYQSLKEELEKANSKLLSMEDEHRKTIELLKEENNMKIHDLEKKISDSLLQQAADDTVIKNLHNDLSAYETRIEALTQNFEQVTADVDLKYRHEIQDLKDWILVEQEEKNQLYNKLQNAEKELETIKTKQVEQQRESITIRHVETLKHKIMKLRKENESLKRQLLASEH